MLRINITTFFLRQARSTLTDLTTRIARDSKVAGGGSDAEGRGEDGEDGGGGAPAAAASEAAKNCPFVFHNDSGTDLDFWIEHQQPRRRMGVAAGERHEFFLPRLGALGNERQRPQTLAIEFAELTLDSASIAGSWGTLAPLPVTRLGAYGVTLGAARLKAIWEVSSDTASGVTTLSIHSAVQVVNECQEQMDVELLTHGDTSYFVAAESRSSAWAPLRHTAMLEAISLRLTLRPQYAQSAPTSYSPGGAIHFCPMRPPTEEGGKDENGDTDDASGEDDSDGDDAGARVGRAEGSSAMALHAASYAAGREESRRALDRDIDAAPSWTSNAPSHVSSMLHTEGTVGPATNMFDGALDATCWCPAGENGAKQWVIIDLQQRYRIARVSIRTAAPGDSNPRECSLLCAENVRGPWRRAIQFRRSRRGGSAPVPVAEVSRFWKLVVHSTHGGVATRITGVSFRGRPAESPEKFAVCVDVDATVRAHATVIRLRPPFVVRNMLPCRLACRLDGVEGARVRGIAAGMEHHFHVLDWAPDMSCASFRPIETEDLAAVTLAMRGRRGVFTSIGRPGHAAQVAHWVQPDAESEAEDFVRAERQSAKDQVSAHEQRTVGAKTLGWLKRLGSRDGATAAESAIAKQREKADADIDLDALRRKARELRRKNGFESRTTKSITLRHMLGGAPLRLDVTQQLEGARTLSTAVLVVRSRFWIVNNSTLSLRYAAPEHRARVEKAVARVAELKVQHASNPGKGKAKSAASLAQNEREAVQPWSGDTLCVGIEGSAAAAAERRVMWAAQQLDVSSRAGVEGGGAATAATPGSPTAAASDGGGASEEGAFAHDTLVVRLAHGHERHLRVDVSIGPGSLYPTRIITIYPAVVLASFVEHTLMLRHGDGQRFALRGEIFVCGDRRPLWQDSSLRGAAKHTIALALSDGPSGSARWSDHVRVNNILSGAFLLFAFLFCSCVYLFFLFSLVSSLFVSSAPSS